MDLPNSNNGNASGFKVASAGRPHRQNFSLAKFLKGIFLFCSTVMIIAFVGLKADLDEQENFLGILGFSENTGMKYKRTENSISLLEKTNQKLKSQVADYRLRIQERRYSTKQDVIADIQKHQRTFFDTKSLAASELEKDNISELGILEIPGKVRDFFNDQDFFDPQPDHIEERSLLYDNQVDLKNISVQNDTLKITAVSKTLYSQVFLLSSSFVDSLNQFPQFSGGFIKNFRRNTNRFGEEVSEFTISLTIAPKSDFENLEGDNMEPAEGDTSDAAFKAAAVSTFLQNFMDWRNENTQIVDPLANKVQTRTAPLLRTK